LQIDFSPFVTFQSVRQRVDIFSLNKSIRVSNEISASVTQTEEENTVLKIHQGLPLVAYKWLPIDTADEIKEWIDASAGGR
jgi:hypothetical protein